MRTIRYVQKFQHALRARLIGEKPLWRWLLPTSLVLLFLFTLLWLPWQAQRMEANERQEQLITDTMWVEQTIRFQLERNAESMRLIAAEIEAGQLPPVKLRDRIGVLVKNNHELSGMILLDAGGNVLISTDPIATAAAVSPAVQQAAERARNKKLPQYSRRGPTAGPIATVMMDYSVPLYIDGRYAGSLVAMYSLSSLLQEMVPWWFAQDNEIGLTDGDDALLAKRIDGGAGRGIYTYHRALDLPGITLALRTDSVKSAPKLLPLLLVGSVVALSLALLGSLYALWRDINRRLVAEDALRQQVSFRSAMENALITGMRARDLDGRITYVNPAFCRMVGIAAQDLIGKAPPMPYWAPEAMPEYQQRFTQILAGTATPQFETIFLRADGERFPVLVFESPLLDDQGLQTGWMGSILDISDRKQAEELNRQQQEKLQLSARLATMGEIASTLAHELNQPLAAISSYTTGALNVLNGEAGKTASVDPTVLKAALEKAHAQAQRAGQIIRSVHAFVKRRKPERTPVPIHTLIDNVAPLIELQARQFSVTIQTDIKADLPLILADSVLLEQVLLNLTRNAIEAMQHVAPERRLLRIAVGLDSALSPHNLVISVIDQGHGMPREVAQRLFSPFFSTKAEGMGMGLNICRTAVEYHGGILTCADNPAGGTTFQFTLPAL